MAWNISPYMNLDNRRYGIVNLDTGDIIIQAQYTSMGYFRCGLAVVHKDFDMGYIDTSGNIRIPFKKYQSGDDFILGFAVVRNYHQKYGLINTIDQIVIPFEYDKIELDKDLIPAVKCVKNDEVKWIDLRQLNNEIVLDGLIYHKTLSIQAFKELMHVKSIHIRHNSKNNEICFYCGLSYGISAITINEHTNRENIVISLVTNVSGISFWLIHHISQLNQPYIKKSKYVAIQQNIEPVNSNIQYHYQDDSDDYWDYDYHNGWSKKDVESGLADAFEYDPDALWNID